VVNRSRWFGLIVLSTLLAGSVAAEDLPLPDPDGLELPYDSSNASQFEGIPLPDAETAMPSPAPQAAPSDGPSRLVAPPQSSSPPGMTDEPPSAPGEWGPADGQIPPEGGYPGEPYAEPDADQGNGSYGAQCGDYYPWDEQPAPIVSSGTWLDRGVWYAQIDGTVLYRAWQKADTFVAANDQNVIIPGSLPAVGLQLTTNRTLSIPSDRPGGDAGVRATLGRFLFRDDENRDHTLEFTAWSAGNWVSENQVSSENPNGLFVTFNLDGGNNLFDQSTFQKIIYDSRLNSFELNYRLKKRLGRDQMVMDPNGNWRREASSGFNRNWLAGFRYVQVDENLNWTAEDIAVNGANGKYNIWTTNDLFGFQFGEGLEFESGRWSAGLSGKMGLYWNDADSHQFLDLTASDTNDFNRHTTQNELAWIGEAEVLGRYHLTPNASLRAGLQVMVIDSLALAPRQINFIDNTNWIETGGNPWYVGGLFGFECFW
jgi:Putative beta barrel porin-7 (BBP7)